MKFSDIHGHSELKKNIIKTIRQGRIAHAQLLISSEGSSSLPLAIAYAQYASCIDKGEDDSCGVCTSCIKYNQLIHPDLHFTFPIFGSNETCDDFINDFRTTFLANPLMNLNDWFSSLNAENKKPNVNVKEIRNIMRKLSLKSYESEYKVSIMWLPEYFGKEGNVLLKLLEEPPEKTLFLLVTEHPDNILTTIISRTQFIKIPRYSYNDVEQYLIGNGIAEGDIAKNAALMSEGNLNKAIKLATEISDPQFDIFRSWLLDCYQGNMSKIISEMDQYSDKGKEGLKLFFLYGLQMLRSAMLIKHQDLSDKLTATELEFAGKLSKLIELSSTQIIYDAFNEAIFEIDRNGSVKLILINLSLKLKNSLRPKVVSPTN